MRCACGLSSASRITLIARYFFFFFLLVDDDAGSVLAAAGVAWASAPLAAAGVAWPSAVVPDLASAAGALVRASGCVSSADGPVTGATVTSPENPGVSAA